MANGHGGARIGAGQKKKALADKIVEGNPGKRKITVMEFSDTASLQGEAMPPPREYLAARQKNGKELLAVEVYERTWTWLNERGRFWSSTLWQSPAGYSARNVSPSTDFWRNTRLQATLFLRPMFP